MASRQKVTTTRVKTRVKKNGATNKAGYKICKNCGGKGVVRNYTKRKP
jgi:DnaJ-class molecular chaperone